MFKNAPINYICPICLGVKQIESEDTLLKIPDLVYKDNYTSVFINSFWTETVEGHAIVVPNEHFENIYEVPVDVGHRIFEVCKKISLAMKKAYNCDGITIRQNNEPAGNQHAFHYHSHIYPRYINDNYNIALTKASILSDPNERIKYAEKLKAAL